MMADEEAETNEDEEPLEVPGVKRSPLVLIIVLINLFAVGGLGVYLIFLQPPPPAAQAAPPPPAPNEFGPMIELMPLVVNLNSEHVGHYVRVTMHLEVADEEAKLSLEQKLVPIRNRLVIYFSELSPDDIHAPGARETIREELVEAINEVLGEPQVRRIFYTDFVVQ